MKHAIAILKVTQNPVILSIEDDKDSAITRASSLYDDLKKLKAGGYLLPHSCLLVIPEERVGDLDRKDISKAVWKAGSI